MPRAPFLLLFALVCLSVPAVAQWEPGSVYREYIWVMPEGGEAFLRVGGRLGYDRQPGKLPAHLQDGDQLILPHDLDLEGAVRAEVTLEKVQSHEDSKNLRIAINGHAPIPVPEPAWIPEPQTEYMYHTDLTVPIPLDQLHAGGDNRFALTLDTTQRWGWPQNVFYGLIFRIYYASNDGLVPGSNLVTALDSSGIEYSLAGPNTSAQSVDYIFVGEDIDWSGRGIQDRKHWQTFRGKPHHILGRSSDVETNFAIPVDLDWIPDQDGFGVQARILRPTGKYLVTKVFPAGLPERDHRVKVYASGPAPRNWVTRSGEFEQSVAVNDDVKAATEIQLNWVSWSPCYANGLFLNGHLIWNSNAEEDCYVWATHQPVYDGLEVKYLQEGENILSTGLTPLFRGQMVHGMEVQWPGIQLKVKYE